MEKMKSATFGQRLMARLIDMILIYAVCYLFGTFLDEGIAGDIENPAGVLLFPIFYLFYYPILEKKGGTFGKQMVDIKTLKNDSLENITYGQAYYRSLILFCPLWFVVFILILVEIMGKNMRDPIITSMMMVFVLLSMVSLIIPPMAVLWTKRQQGYHDIWAKTRVVKQMPQNQSEESQ